MLTEATRLAGPLILTPEVLADARGTFVETFREDELAAAGIVERFVLGAQSRSVRGVVRGLHFQVPPQSRLIRVARGAILDVVVDVRRGSATFGEHVAIELDDVRHQQVYVPPGFAHGFCVVSDEADVVYQMTRYHDPATEFGVAWNDPTLAIPWPETDPVLSDRDLRHPLLSAIPQELLPA